MITGTSASQEGPNHSKVLWVVEGANVLALQVLKTVAKAGKREDFLVLNFGLHFSETYKEELEGVVNEVGLTC